MTNPNDAINGITDSTMEAGLTKREYFASLMMIQSMKKFSYVADAAKYAIEAADALIKRLNRGNS